MFKMCLLRVEEETLLIGLMPLPLLGEMFYCFKMVEDYNLQEEHSWSDRKDTNLENLLFRSSGETSRNQIEKEIGKC